MRCYGVMADGCAGQRVARVARVEWVAGGGVKNSLGEERVAGEFRRASA
jgi:hypothetical protein